MKKNTPHREYLATEHESLLAKLSLRSVALGCVEVYVVVVILSMILAHILLIFSPNSELAAHVIAPVSAGLHFLDDHWKGTLLIIAPFLIPGAEQLLRRIRKLTISDTKIEFEKGVLEDEGVREKPHPAAAEDTP